MSGRKNKTRHAVNVTDNSIPEPSTKRQRVTADKIQKALGNSQVGEKRGSSLLSHANKRTKSLSMKTRAEELGCSRDTVEEEEDSGIVATKCHNLDEISKGVEPLSSVEDAAERARRDRICEYWKSIELPRFDKVVIPSLEELGYDDDALDEYFKNHLF